MRNRERENRLITIHTGFEFSNEEIEKIYKKKLFAFINDITDLVNQDERLKENKTIHK